ncbi:MAG: YgfZ/GcvT domain-containing protein [Actinomycetota bacterium]
MTTAFSVRLIRDVITARGADTRSFLHSQLSNDIISLAPESSRYSFVLEPTGKLSAFLRVRCVAEDHFVLDVDAGCGEDALTRLNKFKIRVKCEFTLTSQHVVAVRGLNAEARTATLAQPGAVAAWHEADGAVDIFAAANGLAVTATPTAPLADLATYHAERVRCAWPIFGIDIDGDTIPAETSLVDDCVSFTKGCYPGQELVERMDSRGSTAPRRLLRLPARPANGVIAAVGEQYTVGDTPLGRCTSVAGEFALVMVTRAHLGDAEALVRS